MVYVGATTVSNSSFYLYTGNAYQTLSLSYCTGAVPHVFILFITNLSDKYIISASYGVRPVISLKPGTEISSGSGTATDPFIVN